MTIELQGLGIIIMVAALCISGAVNFIRIILDSGIIYEFGELLRKTYIIPIFKTKKCRFEIGTIISWINNKSGVRKGVKNFYTWGRITYIARRNKSFKRVPFLAAFSIGKPLESQLKENNKWYAKRKKEMESIPSFQEKNN